MTSVRLRVSLLTISSLFGFFISIPTHSPVFPKPAVKSAFTRSPQTPHSRSVAPPLLTATSVYILDLHSQTTLLAIKPNLRLPPASLTKIMTALVALDYYNPDTLLQVEGGPRSVGAKAELVKDDLITVRDALYALLVPSGNDAAVTLAENFPGGYRKFVEKMNVKVASLGLANTNFVNVSGVDSPNHFTSVYDITMLAKQALDRPLLKSIVSTRKITLKS